MSWRCREHEKQIESICNHEEFLDGYSPLQSMIEEMTMTPHPSGGSDVESPYTPTGWSGYQLPVNTSTLCMTFLPKKLGEVSTESACQ